MAQQNPAIDERRHLAAEGAPPIIVRLKRPGEDRFNDPDKGFNFD